MGLVNVISKWKENVSVKMWKKEEQQSILKIIHEIYTIDCEFSNSEKEKFEGKLNDFGLEMNDVIFMNLDQAIQNLIEDEDKMDVVYSWVAEAIYEDGKVTDKEKDLIDDLVSKYRFSAPKLRLALIKAKKEVK